MSAAPATVASLRREIARRLAPTSPTASLDARVLVAHVLECDPAQLALRDEEPVSGEFVARVNSLAAKRAAGVPVARLVGTKEFFGMALRLSDDTLIPRPDTETLVEAALAALAGERRTDAPLAILDLGTGTGAILLALLARLPNASGVGIDRSAGAVATAADNAAAHGLAERAAFVVGDWTSAVDRCFDLVVSNPPYIMSGAIPHLQVEVRDHDPYLALDGGADGLVAFRTILADLDRVLMPHGLALLEMGEGQGTDVAKLAAGRGFSAHFVADLTGRERVAVLRRTGEA